MGSVRFSAIYDYGPDGHVVYSGQWASMVDYYTLINMLATCTSLVYQLLYMLE